MNIAIVGIGKFGKTLTESLAKENHNITIIDNKADVIESVVEQFDVMGYCGNAASYTTLKDSYVDKADLFIATTSSDETNILCCLVAKKLGVKRTIARIRNPEYALQVQLMQNELGISLTLNPDLDTAHEICRTLTFPSAVKVEPFAEGKVDLVETRVTKDSLICNKSLAEINEKYKINILVCAINRGNEVLIPNGKTIINEGDYIYICSSARLKTNSFKKLNLFKSNLKSALIIGGGRITYYLAKLLINRGISVKIIEKDINICKTLSESLPEAIIINGDATNHALLEEEGIANSDSFITLTGLDETNIILSSYAKNRNCPKVITKVNNPSYNLILNNIGLDSVFSPKEIFTNHIIRFARGMENSLESEFKSLYRLIDDKVEALEFIISKETKYTSIPLKDLKIKKGFLLASIVRENRIIIPTGTDTIKPLDHIVIVTTHKSIKDVSEILE
ncbi:MAG: Trk system potassium transporter TrkA [Erysipelotrichaceae bacterium]|nr:Trk system potassium transporter TrkA [Erysipelotrichaceae bacterium]